MTINKNSYNKKNKKISKEIGEIIKTITFPINHFQNIAIPKEIIEITKQVSGEISYFSKIVKTINETLIYHQKQLTDSIQQASRFTNFFEKLIDFRKDEKKALIEKGWIMCPSLMQISYSALNRAVIKYREGDGGRALTKLIKQFYGASNNWEYLSKTVNSWGKHKLFTKQRMRIIKDSFWAHQHKKYTLSIPSLLPIIEGIAGDYCNKVKGLKVPKEKTTRKVKEVVKLLKLQGDKYEAEILLELILNQLYASTDSNKFRKSKNKKKLNRHGILHGSYSGYPDATRSLKCFMILDVLSLLKA